MRLCSAFLALFLSACASTSTGRQPFPSFSNSLGTTIYLDDEISALSLLVPTIQLKAAREPVTMYINSPGGEVYSGLAFLEVMQATKARGVPVTCIVKGMAASMAAVILEGCSLRLMTKQSSILFHTVSISGGSGGNAWELARLVQAMQELNKRLAIFVSGALKISLKCYEAHVADKDWWLGYEEALEVGAVDGVL